MRASFVRQRLTRPVTEAEAKDLTDFFHAEKAEIQECSNCTLLIRREHERPPAEEYSKDEYDREAVERNTRNTSLLSERKRHRIARCSRRGARVLGGGQPLRRLPSGRCASGAWQAEGVDVGKDTSAFASSKGFVVHNVELQNGNSPLQSSTEFSYGIASSRSTMPGRFSELAAAF